jgi:isopropylmalate/homocitrate/citramalate synthase
LIGRPEVRIALGKGCGNANVEEKLEQRGRTATPEQVLEIVSRVKQTAIEKKALLTDEEFDSLVNAVVGE